MVWSLSRDAALQQAFRYGIACATASLTSTANALCMVADVQTWLDQVVCTSHLPEVTL
jgi:fructose-1-phosphate kinase PfkB-like protein